MTHTEQVTAPDQQLAFVRHGATQPNLAGLRCGGDLDVPLTELGRGQALLAARRILAKGPSVGLIVSSGLQRTDETARIIASQLGGIELLIEPGFVERHLGDWNLCPLTDTEPWLAAGMTPPGGECNARFSQRIEPALEQLLPLLHRRPLLVSSRGVGRVLGELTGRPGRTVLGNGEVERFDLSAFGELRSVGSAS